MQINVMMSSGETDCWEDAADAIDDRGSLLVLFDIEGTEVPAGMKTLEIHREIEQEGADPMQKTTTFQVAAQYAPGMWMKVEFE